MENRELEEQLRAAGVSEEDLAKVGPGLERALTKSGINMATHRLVFEVVKAKNCLYGAQKGQKIVIAGSAIDTEASDCPLCMGLVAPLLPSTMIFYDRCINGNLEDPMPEGVRCIDPGLDCPEVSGLGEVLVVPRIEPIS
jgi:hypothetical protein